MRATLVVRRLEGLKAKQRAKTAAQRARILQVIERSAERVFLRAVILCPVDTGFMVEHLRVKLTREGYNYVIGWYREDFTGQGLDFYAVYVVLGTRYQAANDPISPALRSEHAQLMRELRAALAA